MEFRRSSPSSDLRESIRFASTGERKYIRYFDGRGHYAHIRLQLLPRPGQPCSVSLGGDCSLPGDAYEAVRAALLHRFEQGPGRHLPLIGVEAHLTGGSYSPQYSHPAACAAAACMAYDDALPRAAPMLVEPWIGVSLNLPWNALATRMERLLGILRDVRVVAKPGASVALSSEIPRRSLPAVTAACEPAHVHTFSLAPESQYREVVSNPGSAAPSAYSLGEWT